MLEPTEKFVLSDRDGCGLGVRRAKVCIGAEVGGGGETVACEGVGVRIGNAIR